MKTYKIKAVISAICFAIAIISFVLSVLCLTMWEDTTYTIFGFIATIGYIIVGICSAYGAKEDYEDYIDHKKYIQENFFDRLSYLFRDHWYKLDIVDVDYLVPAFNHKHRVLQWAADIAVACQVYQMDYDLVNNDPKTNDDIELMIELAKNLITNKKYI